VICRGNKIISVGLSACWVASREGAYYRRSTRLIVSLQAFPLIVLLPAADIDTIVRRNGVEVGVQQRIRIRPPYLYEARIHGNRNRNKNFGYNNLSCFSVLVLCRLIVVLLPNN